MTPPPVAPLSAPKPDNLGKDLEVCRLGQDCPFEGAVRRLEREQHDRIDSEAGLAVRIDEMIGKVTGLCRELEELTRRVRELEFHIRKARLVDLAIMSIGAGLGGFLAKMLMQ